MVFNGYFASVQDTRFWKMKCQWHYCLPIDRSRLRFWCYYMTTLAGIFWSRRTRRWNDLRRTPGLWQGRVLRWRSRVPGRDRLRHPQAGLRSSGTTPSLLLWHTLVVENKPSPLLLSFVPYSVIYGHRWADERDEQNGAQNEELWPVSDQARSKAGVHEDEGPQGKGARGDGSHKSSR